MPANKFALLRYRIIDRSIRGKFPSKEDLRQACEDALYGSDGVRISASTIDKDLWAMRNEGDLGYYAPIKFSKEYGGYYYEDPDYTIAELPLSDEDLKAIKAAAETLYQFRDIPLFQQFDSAIEKIFDRMAISGDQPENGDSEVIQFERVGSYKGSEFLQPLYNVCYTKKPIRLGYTKFQSEEVKEYDLDPHILKEYRGRWYLLAYDRNEKKMRTMSLDRVVSLIEIVGSRIDGIGFNSIDFFKYSIGITVTGETPMDVAIRFSERMSPYIKTQPLHPSQKLVEKKNGSVEVSLRVLNTPELISSILWFGKDAEVVSPDSLRAQVKSVLTQGLEMYSD